MSVTARCQNCGLERDPQDTGSCPRCGHQGRHLVAVINEVVRITDRVGSYISPNYRPTTRDRVSVFSVFLIVIAEFFISFFPQPHSIIFGGIAGMFAVTVSPILKRSWHLNRN